MRQRLKDLIGGIAVTHILRQLFVTQRRLVAHHHVQVGVGSRLGGSATQLLLLLLALVLCQQLLGIVIVSVNLLGGLLHRHRYLVRDVEATGYLWCIGHHQLVQAKAFHICQLSWWSWWSWLCCSHLDLDASSIVGQQLDVVVLVVVGADVVDDLQRLEVRVGDVVDALCLQALLGADQIPNGTLAILWVDTERDRGARRINVEEVELIIEM